MVLQSVIRNPLNFSPDARTEPASLTNIQSTIFFACIISFFRSFTVNYQFFYAFSGILLTVLNILKTAIGFI